MAFHLGCLRALDDLGLLERVRVLSTISGGSVIGAYYAYSPQKTFAEFDADICRMLTTGLQRGIMFQALKPWNFIPGLAAFAASHVQDALAYTCKLQPIVPRFRSRTDAFEEVLHRRLFPNLRMDAPRRNGLDIVVGACELRLGTAFRFGNAMSGSWRHGELSEPVVDVSFAVAASAAYPILMPALDRKLRFVRTGETALRRVLLADGGIYDNLGLQVLEPGRDPRFSLHTFPCDHIIACNAGRGLDAGVGIPLGFGLRVKRAFEVVHRRVQDSAMHRLHTLMESGQISGFAMPYLGQQDEALPWKPPGFVARSEVVNYPTNFAAMSPEWIMKLSNRGEQLTRVLVSTYLAELLG